MLGVAELSPMSPINSIANPVVLVSITTAPQKLSMVTSLRPPEVVTIAGLVATGSIFRYPCLKFVVPIKKLAVGMVAAEIEEWFVRTMNSRWVFPDEIVNVEAVAKAVLSF